MWASTWSPCSMVTCCWSIPQSPQSLLTLAAGKLTELKRKGLNDKFIICLNKLAKHFPPFMDG